MMASVQMCVLNLGINGGFPFITSNSCFSSHEFSISQCPNFTVTSNCSTVKKSLDFGRRKAEFGNAKFSIAFNYNGMKKSRNFDRREAKFSTVSALEKADVDTHSTCVQISEKELNFSPTFQDYLKVMESVRTDRSKNPNVNMDVVSPEKRSAGKGDSHRHWENVNSRRGKLNHRGSEKDSTDKKNGGIETRGGGWGLVERILVKKTSGKGGEHLKDAKDFLNKGLQEAGNTFDGENFEKERDGIYKLKEQSRSEVRRVHKLMIPDQSKGPLESRSSVRPGNIKRVGNSSEIVFVKDVNNVSNGRKSMEWDKMKQNKLLKSDLEREVIGFEKDKNLINKTSIRSNTDRKLDESLATKTSSQSSSFHRNSKKSDESEGSKNEREDVMFLGIEHRKTKINVNVSERYVFEKEADRQSSSLMKVRFQDDNRETDKLGSFAIEMRGRSSKSNTQLDTFDRREIDFEDRAAFKTFEVFTDVRNRPRVLRMELEERIHKLAKQLNATDVNMPEWQFSKMIHGAKIKFTEHSILRMVQILGMLGNWKRTLQVVQWLQSRERFKTYKSRYIYTTVLDVLGKAKRPIEALNIFYAMREDLSSYPDLAAYHCIAVTLGQAGLMKELFDVIDCMRAPPEKKFKLGVLQKWDPRLEPDLVIYHAVLNACIQWKQWEGAFWVLQQLKQQNIRPTNTTFGLIMEVMLACGKYNLVHELFRKVEKTSIPSALNYKVLVNTLWREGKTDEAVLAVKDMERRGVVGSASLYYDLARCLCSAGRCQEALLQVDKICKVAKKPLVVTYTGLIQACLDAGSIENGAYIFNEMHKFCAPNIVTCNIMLKSYIQHGMFDEANDLFQKILDGSQHIKTKCERDRKAIPDKFTFNTMMDACAARNNWDDFEYAYEQMLHHGYHFDARRHIRIVLDAFRAGKMQVIETTWDHLIRFGRDPPPPIIQARFCIKLQEDDHLAAVSCIEALPENEVHALSMKSCLNLLESNVHRFKNDTIFRLMHELDSMIDERDGRSPTYQNILDACRKFTKITNDPEQKFCIYS